MQKAKTPIWVKLVIVAMTFAAVTSPEWVRPAGDVLTGLIVFVLSGGS